MGILACVWIAGCAAPAPAPAPEAASRFELVVLGIAQDGGALEIERLGRMVHFAGEIFLYGAASA